MKKYANKCSSKFKIYIYIYISDEDTENKSTKKEERKRIEKGGGGGMKLNITSDKMELVFAKKLEPAHYHISHKLI